MGIGFLVWAFRYLSFGYGKERWDAALYTCSSLIAKHLFLDTVSNDI
jgi:hypothetical protein